MTVSLPSNRSFGLLFFAVFGAYGAYSWWRGSQWAWISLALAGVFLLVTLVKPDLLTPLNKAWMMLAHLLSRIFSPIVLGVLFFLIFTPVALVMRLAKRDTMHRKWDKAAASYWILRTPPGPPPDSLRDQF